MIVKGKKSRSFVAFMKTEVVVVRIGPLLIYLDLVETNYKSPSKEFAHFKFRMWESLVMLRTGKH